MVADIPHHADKGPYVAGLVPGARVVGFYLVRYKQLEPFRDRSRGHYLTLTLADRTGQVLARVWENAAELAAQFEPGDIVKVAGDVESYRDRTQLIVTQLRRARADEFDLRDMRRTSRRAADAMQAELRQRLDGVQNVYMNRLLRHFFDDPEFMVKFSEAPAARRVHHAYLGGLLEHTLQVAALADRLLEIYPQLDADLLQCGVLLHDIGKVREFVWDTDIDYTDEGRLVGHVVLGAEMVAPAIAAIPEFPPELALRIKHMIVSHHGRYEWGAPRRPKTVEAMALHHLEDLDAQVNRFDDLLSSRREPGQPWTQFDRLLRRPLFAGMFTSDDDGELSVEESSQLT